MHLVGFIIRIYQDARSDGRQIQRDRNCSTSSNIAGKSQGAVKAWLLSFLNSTLEGISNQLHDTAALPREE